MRDLKNAWRYSNLQKAWGWIKSNPDRLYKSYFREIYSGYAVAEENLLKHLENKLNRGIYEPQNSIKIFTPKPSGILRPYTLISIEDQIVYQAIANVIAEKINLKKNTNKHIKIYGHLYAGANSTWFYKKWSDGYNSFNTSSIDAFNEGRIWTATFDLTAFYDSIDHNVLSQILRKYSLSAEFCDYLNSLLTKWTATGTRIYHNHGIPQGPLSSGIVSEAVLSHIDKNFKPLGDVKYIRYVDDIRLFSRTENELRHALVQLDRLSKDVGLFPQSGKINIHRIEDINQELKSISNPFDIFLDESEIQNNVNSELKKIASAQNNYKVTNSSRFKYLLAVAKPTLRILNRALSVLEHSPEFHIQVSQYIKKFKHIPEPQADRIIELIKKNDLYPTVQASLIDACTTFIVKEHNKTLKKLFKTMWNRTSNTVDLTVKLWVCLNKLSNLNDKEKTKALSSKQMDWFKAQLIQETDSEAFNIITLSNQKIKDPNNDVAISSAWLSIKNGVKITEKSKDINAIAKIILQTTGKIKKSSIRVCGIKSSINEISGVDSQINWRTIFGAHYKNAESKIVTAKGYYKTNPTAFVNSMDSFNDLLLHCVSIRDGTVGEKLLGNFNIKETSKFAKKYPKTFNWGLLVHSKRHDSELSHAVNRGKNGKPTGKIPFSWLSISKNALKLSISELEQHF